MARGKLRVYLGAAPGVGKTYAMLNEGWRRHERGTDVVVGYMEPHRRPATAAQARDLPVIPRARLSYRGRELEEMDLDAVLARHPVQVLIDEMAHTNVPGSRNEKRWQDIEEVLAAGIDVITTVNIQHLTSLNDLVERITGVTQRETIPDAVVRRADQIELVDMTPEALRRRMAHGHIYPPEEIDAALANYFREGNLGALRELALLWVADRVDAELADYRERHGIREPWETRERLVVALKGGASGEHLVRRASRMAERAHAELVGVHIRAADGLVVRDPAGLEDQRRLLGEVGGRYAEVTGTNVARSLLEFARAENASQVVLGASSRPVWSRLLNGSVINGVIRNAGPIDIHVISAPGGGEGPRLASLRRRPPVVPPIRRNLGLLLATAGVVLVGLALSPIRGSLGVPGVLLCLLLGVVGVAALGGLVPGLVATLVAALTADFFFVPPVGSLDIASPTNVVALCVFLAVAALITAFIDQLARRHLQLLRARVETEALARLAGGAVLAEAEPLPNLVAELRRTFDLDAVAVLNPGEGGWVALASAGTPVPARPEDAALAVELDQGAVLVAAGHALGAEDRPLLAAFAAQLRQVQERIRLEAQVASAAQLAGANDLRAALLAAVSHDLRTPLAGIKAAATSLLSTDVRWEPAQLRDFYATINSETDSLTHLIDDLLDMSRVQSGSLPVAIRPTDVDEVVEEAVTSLPRIGTEILVDVGQELPEVEADAALLERALANIIANAQAWSPAGKPVRVSASAIADRVQIRVIDRGLGIPAERRQEAFRPFQRLGDRNGHHPGGLGLGLAIARGFVAAMGGEVEIEDTPGGGATLVVSLRRAEE
ncbi:MAG TPA: ATP-binding protein [Candidatus Binatia bacterium]|nr:ATP-binding protein [Candidatus Binatia bacterium]